MLSGDTGSCYKHLLSIKGIIYKQSGSEVMIKIAHYGTLASLLGNQRHQGVQELIAATEL